MGIKITVGGKRFEAISYVVSEAGTPLSADDSSGSVGSIDFDVPYFPDSFLIVGEVVTLSDSKKGSTLGEVVSVKPSDDSGVVRISCVSRLGQLNVFGIQAQPFSGTLRAAFETYMGLAGISSDLFVDEQVADRRVVFIGWHGELWFHLKQLAAAQDCEVALVSDVILLRPVRTREAVRGRDTGRGREYGGGTLAQAVEIYQYNSRAITNQPVYPPNGWTPEVEVISISAGETVEQVLELSASVSFVEQPVMVEFVAQDYTATSVFTVVGDDGFPIKPAAWAANGGSLRVSIEPDTTHLKVEVTAPQNLPNSEGKEMIQVYSVALGSDTTGNRYSTLRLRGSGVAFDKQVVRVRTGVPPRKTATEVGVTIDNFFINTTDDVYRAGTKAAKNFAGEGMSISGSVTAVNQRGDSGAAQYPTYAVVQSRWQGRTYAQVQSLPEVLGKTYEGVRQFFYDTVRNTFANQLFGNVGGARVWDKRSRRWYRIRSASIPADVISFDADDDLLHRDVQAHNQGHTYAEDREWFSGLTYSKRDRMGLYRREYGGLPDDAFPSVGLFPALTLFPQDGELT